MRDVERLKERAEITLEGGQITAAVTSALVLLAVVFAIGVLVGKRLAAAAPPAAPVGDLAALDEQQKREASAPKLAAAAIVPNKPTEPAAEPPAKPAEDADVPEQGKPPEELPAAKPSTTAKAAPAKPAEPAPLKLASAAPPPPKHEPEHELRHEPEHEREPEPRREPHFGAPPKELGEFTVQVGASQDKTEAARLEQRAKAAGLKAYVLEAHLGAKGTWYRVRVGAFHDKDSAGRYRHDVERELRTAAVVMPTH